MRNKGFSLLESLLVIFILAILLSIAIPVFKKQHILDLSQISRQLKQALELAKSAAVNQQSIVTVCGSSDALHCDHRWSQGYLIFVDKSGKGFKQENDPIIAFKQYEQDLLHIQWQGFLSADFIQFSPDFRQGQNGTLSLRDRLGRQQKLIINSVGRIRLETD